jgi:hypothetical protein
MTTAFACAALAAGEGARPSIKTVSLEGTNIVMKVSVTAGFERLVLESGDATRWEPRLSIPLENKGGDFTLRLPRIGQMQLVRVRADAPSQSAVSSELSYLSAPSQTTSNGVVLRIRGKLDGTDKIVITRDGAVWEHVSWDWPQSAVWINDTQWIPREKNIIAPGGTAAFIPENADFPQAKLQRKSGRDTVALERTEQALIIYVADTLAGADDYDFTLHVPLRSPKPARPSPGPAAILKVQAYIDGSDQLHITASGAQWAHRHWQWPGEVRINDVPWFPSTNATLSGSFLPANINFATARVIDRKGRDMVAAEASADAVVVHFADNPAGAADYAITLQFGP